MSRMASGQSQRLDGIIFVEHHLARQFGVIFSLSQPLPPKWPPHMFSLLCEDPATNGSDHAIKVVKLANRSQALAK